MGWRIALKSEFKKKKITNMVELQECKRQKYEKITQKNLIPVKDDNKKHKKGTYKHHVYHTI